MSFVYEEENVQNALAVYRHEKQRQLSNDFDSASAAGREFVHFGPNSRRRTTRIIAQHKPASGQLHQQQQYASQSATTTHSTSYYLQCAAGGVLSSSVRWVLNPLEVLKGYQQTRSSSVGVASSSSMVMHGGGSGTLSFTTNVAAAATTTNNKYSGIVSGLRTIWVEEGFAAGLYKGLGCTAVSYAIQTGGKYSLYEVFKDNVYGGGAVSDHWVRIASAASAEMVADVFMCPWEQLRVKVQTSPPNSAFPTRLGPAVSAMMMTQSSNSKAKMPSPFATLVPLWARQVPGTVANFYSFEYFVKELDRLCYAHFGDNSPLSPLAITFVAGYGAGVVVAVVSHPADSLLSLYAKQQHMNSTSNSSVSMLHQHRNNSTFSTLLRIVREVGFYRLATCGLAPRMLLTGTIIGGQWWIYDSFKTAMGMGVTGR